jgi:Kef-type K+ transport system membrane component KefB
VTPAADGLPPELDYVVLLFALFVVPRMLQRYRLPAAVTAVALGALAGMGFGIFTGDATVRLLAVLGIVALFLFAGLEVDLLDLRREARIILQHLAIAASLLVLTTVLAHFALRLGWRPAALVALALLTPSTGFILDSLPSLGVSEAERFWIKAKAIASELLALGLLFVVLQSTTVARLSVSGLVLVGMILILPLVFRFFAARILPYAPRSEFAFLVMLAVLCAFVTRRLGVYYLVGAFVVGLAAQNFRRQLPAIASDRTLQAVELFASFFVPFYFFAAGLKFRTEDFGWGAVGVAGAFLAIIVPVRIAAVALHRRAALGEGLRIAARIGVATLPTLVFTLVIAEILRERFAVAPEIFGGLIIYTLANTLVPGFSLRLPAGDLDIWHEPEGERAESQHWVGSPTSQDLPSRDR